MTENGLNTITGAVEGDPKKNSGGSGSVLVVGGGIGGMQSALDLAESGFKVYLVEKKPAIGRMMARLDKTFPTNDCAMCTMSPKLVDTDRHLNIEIITGAEVKRVDGNPGNFRVQLKKKARYVDTNKCTDCGDCARTCPVDLPNEFDDGLGDHKAAYKLYRIIPGMDRISNLRSHRP